jgi:hypothetical protein
MNDESYSGWNADRKYDISDSSHTISHTKWGKLMEEISMSMYGETKINILWNLIF